MLLLQLLGRSPTIGDYVKKGEDEGFTEIVLSKDTAGGRITIRRTMKKEGTSSWKINSASCKPVIHVLLDAA